MASESTFQAFTDVIPLQNLNITTLIGFATVFVVFLIVAIIAGIVTYLIVRNIQFKYSIVIFEKVSGKFEPTRKDKGKEVKIGDLGQTVLFCRKSKKYLPMPDSQTGRRTFWYYIEPKGKHWVNFTMDDIDENLSKTKLKFSGIEVGYANVAIRKNLKERFMKQSFLSIYGGLIMYTMLIAISGIMIWLLFDKFIALTGSVNGAVESANEVLIATKDILVALDNIKGGGSGIVAA